MNISSIQAARRVLKSVMIPTPIIQADELSTRLGAQVYLKAENVQPAGSFKVRGAFNKIHNLSPEEKARGVIAPSAGNHAQGVALAAKRSGIKATIVMPEFAPLTKVVATRKFGAEVILHGKSFDDAAARVRELVQERGLTLIHAFDDEDIIAGQGTCGLEILDQLPDVNRVVVPIGGGGLIGGIGMAIKTLKPDVKIIGVQAAGNSSIRPSLAAGMPVMAERSNTIADGIAVKRPGDLTLPLIKQFVDDVVEVDEEEIARGIVHCVNHSQMVVEGGGAVGVAALLAGKIKPERNEIVSVVLSGGNIDGNLLARVIEQVMVRQGRYIWLKLTVPDRPGSLAPLIEEVAECRANIVEIFHRRAMRLAPLGRVGIELVLEVRDEEHGREVMQHLINSGYPVEREGLGHWPT